jgi:cobalamin biosynthesis Mg chelatase CobN
LLASKRQPGREIATATARCHRAMRRLLTALTILCLAAPAAAGADAGVNKLLRDACSDEHINGTYTQAEYKKALEQLPTDSDEYTGCREVLQRGRLAALGAGKRRNNNSGGAGSSTGGGGTSGGSGAAGRGSSGSPSAAPSSNADPLASATPEQRKALAQVGKSTKPVDVGGQLVQPGALGLGQLSSSGRDVPTPLIAIIGLLAATALGVGGWWLWSRVLARRFG